MYDIVNIIPHIYRIGFIHILIENVTGYILTVNLICASGGYLLFDNYTFLDDITIGGISIFTNNNIFILTRYQKQWLFVYSQ